MNNFTQKFNTKYTQIFFGVALAATTTWLLLKKFSKPKQILYPGEIGLDLERYKFQVPSSQNNESLELERLGSSFAVRLKGKYLGRIFKRGQDWIAKGKALRPYLDVIVQHLPNSGTREAFPDILRGVYPEIDSTNWKTKETLEVIINKHTDIEVFTTFLKDEIANLTEFDEHLDLMVKKAEDNYFAIVSVN